MVGNQEQAKYSVSQPQKHLIKSAQMSFDGAHAALKQTRAVVTGGRSVVHIQSRL